MSKTKNPTGLALAVELFMENRNDWGGSDDVEKIAAARFAVVVERDSDSWVLAAESWEDVAGIYLGCLQPDGEETEYIEAIYDVATGEQLRVNLQVTAQVTTPEGEVFTVTSA
jgi:hypothetical protein